MPLRQTLAEEIAIASIKTLEVGSSYLGCITYIEDPNLEFQSFGTKVESSLWARWKNDFNTALDLISGNQNINPVGEIDMVYMVCRKATPGVEDPPSPILDARFSKSLGLNFVEVCLIDLKGSIECLVPIINESAEILPVFEFSTQSRIENYMRSRLLHSKVEKLQALLSNPTSKTKWIQENIIPSAHKNLGSQFYLTHALD